MNRIPESKILRWSRSAAHNVPSQVSIHCANCKNRVVYQIDEWNYSSAVNTEFAQGTCSVCRCRERFILLDPTDKSVISPKLQGELYSTAPASPDWPVIDANSVPPEVYRTYISTVQTLDAGVWTATATCCQRALETIVREKLPAEQQPQLLASAIEEIAAGPDLSQPLRDISLALREGGNLAEHLELRRESDAETARSMIELLEALIRYLYKLPATISGLDGRFSNGQSAEP